MINKLLSIISIDLLYFNNDIIKVHSFGVVEDYPVFIIIPTRWGGQNRARYNSCIQGTAIRGIHVLA